MKRKITAADYDKLSDEMKAEYKESGGSYILKVEGEDGREYDPEAAIRARDNANRERDEARRERDEYKRKEDERKERLEAKRKEKEGANGTEGEKALRKRLDDIEKERKREKEELAAREDRDAVEAVARELDGLFVATDLAAPWVRSRLSVERVDGKPVVRVKDKDGKVSASTVEEFRQEILTTESFKGNLRATVGSGGGAPNPSGGGGAPTKLSDFKTATEEAVFANANPDKYQAMLDAAKAGS